jgi:tryptophanyl-tRNA synthetase
MYTDPNHLRVEDPGSVEGNCVFTYLDAFSRPEHFAEFLPDYACLDELKEHYKRGGLGDVKCKKFLYAVLEEMLQPIRARRHEYEQDIEGVYEILKKGCQVARAEAAETLDMVRRSVKINYFEDVDLIRQQSEAYKSAK